MTRYCAPKVLRRHALERRDLGYDAFLQTILSPDDWAYQQQVAQMPAQEREEQ